MELNRFMDQSSVSPEDEHPPVREDKLGTGGSAAANRPCLEGELRAWLQATGLVEGLSGERP
jgi:hypothetical protein